MSRGKRRGAVGFPRLGASRSLRDFLYRDEIVTPLLDQYGCAWLDGGCGVLAEALHRHLGGNIVAIRNQGDFIEHVVLEYASFYLDGDGISTRAELEKRWAEDECVNGAHIDGNLTDEDKKRVWIWDEELIERLVNQLKTCAVLLEFQSHILRG